MSMINIPLHNDDDEYKEVDVGVCYTGFFVI